MGQFDPAALLEFEKARSIVYELDTETCCLVEMDEEPPHELAHEALEKALLVSHMLNARPMDEIHVMRKVVIDGSNTTGFQRTCVVALNGHLEVNGKTIGVQHVGLEEDAGRKTAEDERSVTYRLDRLGIPLIEVTTEPAISSAKEAKEVAARIGSILRATGSVKRGLGTIRQDLNVSIPEGALVEIKGVQYLDLIAKVIDYEVERQRKLLSITKELKTRRLKEDHVKEDILDLTENLSGSKSKVLSRARQGFRILGVRLPAFGGLLGEELVPGTRLGTEMAQRAIVWAKVGGIIHTDELPGYGISSEEKAMITALLKCRDQDAGVLVVDVKEKAERAIKAVIARAREALAGVPEETRGVNQDGTSRYLRPRPGAARMYPETDIPPVPVTGELLRKISETVPELPEDLAKRLVQEFRLSPQQSRVLVESENLSLFHRTLAATTLPPSFVATVVTETLTSLARDGVEIGNLTEDHILGALQIVHLGKTAKESVSEILTILSKNPEWSPEEALKRSGLEMLSRQELELLIRGEVKAQRETLRGDLEAAMGKAMKRIMGQVRGRAEASVVTEILKEIMREDWNQ